MSNGFGKKILIFAGTNEGRKLCEFLAERKQNVTACVATEYGSLCLSGIPGLQVREGRLSGDEIGELVKAYDYVLDATHPYARLISENLARACDSCKKACIRVVRPQTEYENVIACGNMEAACEYLRQTEGNVLITTGSKELQPFTGIAGYAERLYVRVLPHPESLEECIRHGFRASNIICMQGPFTEELNFAMLRQVKASYMVTKEAGKAGGFEEKLKAAGKCGVKVLVIGRPVKEEGLSLQEAIAFLKRELLLSEEKDSFFPMFMRLEKKKIIVIGAGKIAARRIKTLLQFSADITVVAPEICEDLLNLGNQLTIRRKEFEESDIEDAFLTVAATDAAEVNRRVYEAARSRGILFNTADNKELCDFYFPAVFSDEEVIGGIISRNGENHRAAKQKAEKIRAVLKD